MQWMTSSSEEWCFSGRPINLRKPKADSKTFQIFVLKNFRDIYFGITSQPLSKVDFQGFISGIGVFPGKVFSRKVLNNICAEKGCS